YRPYFRQGKPSDALQVIHHLFLLVEELRVIIDVLPRTSPARAKMLAKRRFAVWRSLLNLGHTSLQVLPFDFINPGLDHITGGATLQENHASLVMCNAFALGGHSFNRQ